MKVDKIATPRFASWHASPDPGRALFNGLDGIRGIAIFLVVSSHTIPFLYMDTPLKRMLCVISSNGTTGVWLFFVLSGFLISLPFFKRLDDGRGWYPPGYALRRAAKVIPPLYLSIILVTILCVVETHNRAYIRSGIETMAFFEIFHVPGPVITPIYWTLAAEASFYAVLPFLFFLLRKPVIRYPWIVPALFIGTSAVVWVCVSSNPAFVEREPFIRDVLLSFGFFGWGSLFSCFHIRRPALLSGRAGLKVALGLTTFACCCIFSTYGWLEHLDLLGGLYSRLILSTVAGVGAFFMLCVVYDPDAPVRRFLCNPLLSFAGLLSYEWYLFHILFIRLSDRITGSELHGSYGKLLIRILFSFPMAFAFAMLVYRFFSLPILRWAHGVRRG